MKILKIILGVGVLLLVLAIGLAVFVFGNINHIVKQVVETVGPDITRTSVRLERVDIKIFRGKGELNDFVVGNPAGFDSEHLLKWDTVRVQIDPATVRSEVIVIKDVVIEGVNIKAEQKGYATNLQKLLDNLKSGASSNGDAAATAQSEEAEVRLVLEKLRFADNSIDFISERYGSYTIELPAFELADVGDKNTGLTPAELGQAVLRPLVKAARKSVEQRLKDLSKEELEAKLEAKKEEIVAEARAKEAALKAKADAQEEELEQKLKQEKERLDKKKAALKEKFGEDAEEQLKNLLERD